MADANQISLADAYGGPDASTISLDEAYGQPMNPHDVIPYAKSVGSNLMDLAGQAGSGIKDAILHPSDTAHNVLSSIANAEPSDVYRGIRNIPVVGPAINAATIAAQGIPGYFKGGDEGQLQAVNAQDAFEKAQNQADIAHQQEHPLTDFIQKTLPSMALPEGAAGKVAGLALDSFLKSVGEGNSAYDAVKDARNTALFVGTALGAGKGLSLLGQTANAGETALGKPVTLPDEMPGAPKVIPPEAPPLPAPMPEAPPAPTVPPPLQNPISSAEWGKTIGRTVGTAVGATGGPIPALVGGKLGESLGGAVDRLTAVYGTDLVKSVNDAGIAVGKLADSPYIGPIMKAAQQGPKDLAVAHYMYSQSDPNYQALTVTP